ncbi:phospholipid methyltransferase-domain-containing protein [Desarmillaria tabescens]|uniref:Phosphatidyl-N-methylethanolamine N-methyltransferase n=1 Tax=Armillaria tabescens TaxID=1929756 RepID=A0AA39TYE3_ARMTA|nr:phospholipid methyltransferase-domain-containing protein [Desarmillaria tabescens]KAK0469963.1 phospholipid methyltransferase-domain-containing protein [Desarmillaria tabescens]
MDTFHSLVDISKPSLFLSLAAITFNPTAWNIVARNEYRNKTITRIFGGSPKAGCYFLAVMIFSFGMLRDYLYHAAMAEQPKVELLPEPYSKALPLALMGTGQLLVVSSTWALGVTGTFLGDYFGILMDHRVEGFPFNVLNDPMYVGSTMCFLAGALWESSPAGLFITLYVYIVYIIALRFEGPFTDMMYSKRAEELAKASKKD